MVDSKIGAIDVFGKVMSDPLGACDALCLSVLAESNDLAGMVSRVHDVDVDSLREVIG